MRPSGGFRAGRCLLAVLSVIMAAGPSAADSAQEAPLAAARALVGDSLGAYAGIASYEVTLKREYHDPEHSDLIFLHFEKPDILFMEWLGGEGRDRQLLYAPHAFGAKLQVRPPGLFFRLIPIVELDKNDPRILKAENRSIDRAGIGPFLEKFAADFAAADAAGRIKEIDARTGGGAELTVLFDDPDREYPKVRIVFDAATRLPSRIELYRRDGTKPDVYLYSEWNLDPQKTGVLRNRIDPRMRGYLDKARSQRPPKAA